MHHQKLLCMLHSCHVRIPACCVRESALLKNYFSYAAQFGYPLSTSLPTGNTSIVLSHPTLSFSKKPYQNRPKFFIVLVMYLKCLFSCCKFMMVCGTVAKLWKMLHSLRDRSVRALVIIINVYHIVCILSREDTHVSVGTGAN